jgi:opacity protein-like surface antigen
MIRTITIACAVALVLTGSAWAQTTTPAPVQPSPAAPEPLTPEPEAFTFTPFIGIGTSGDYENTPTALGAALGYGIDTRWAVEGELSFLPNGEQGDILEFETSVWTLSGNVLYHFLQEDFTPYATFGLGWMGASADFEDTDLDLFFDDDTANKFAWNWGAGIKTAMNQNWGVRGDLRFFNGEDLAPDHWRLYGGVVLRRIGR